MLLDINIKVFYKILKQMDVDVIDKKLVLKILLMILFCENIVTQNINRLLNILHRDYNFKRII